MNGTYWSYLRRESLSMGLRVALRKEKTNKQTKKHVQQSLEYKDE